MDGHLLEDLETELTLRGLSESTKRAYSKYNAQFLEFIKARKISPQSVSKREIKLFLAQKIKEHTAPRTINLIRSALLFYYNEVLEMGIVGIKVPKISKSLPIYLTKSEVKQLIDAAGSKKSEILIKFLYSSGLRVSEICNLRIEDLDIMNRRGFVRSGKGGKDRLFFIAKSLGPQLWNLVGDQKQGIVFANHNGEKMSERNVQKIVATAAKRAQIQKKVTPHKLRHSFATHLHDSGTSIRTIQELLGHSNLQTTEIYTHVSATKLEKVKNPLSDLE